jgi:DNA-binding XRE family transcriptional regulator
MNRLTRSDLSYEQLQLEIKQLQHELRETADSSKTGETPVASYTTHATPGDVLRGFRVLCGMTREELADKLGASRHAIGSWEGNRTALKLSVVRKIAAVFAPFDDLFWEAMKITADLEHAVPHDM